MFNGTELFYLYVGHFINDDVSVAIIDFYESNTNRLQRDDNFNKGLKEFRQNMFLVQ